MHNLPTEIAEKLDLLPLYDATAQDLLEPSGHKESDECFAQIIDYYTQTDSVARDSIAERLSGKEAFLLFFAFRMAVQTIRTNDPKPLFPGIMALVLDNLHSDWRDTIVRLTLLKYAAQKVGVSIGPLFNQAAQYASPECNKLIKKVSSQRVTLSSIKKAGFDEGTSKHGFVFQVKGW